VEVFGFEGSVGGFKKRFQRGGEPRWRFLGFEGLDGGLVGVLVEGFGGVLAGVFGGVLVGFGFGRGALRTSCSSPQ
jgi:hypothetical protein